jgi:hypothetical protein
MENIKGMSIFRLEKTNSSGDAFNILTLPFHPLASARFHCCRCNCNLSNSFELLEHELLKYKCSQCQLRFCTSKLRRQHRFKNHKVRQSCTDCSLTFSTRVQLRDHLQLMPFSCACCSLHYHSKTALQLHLVQQMKIKSSSDFERAKAQTLEVKSHQCLECRAQLSSSNQLALHMDMHSGSKFKCGHCGAQYLRKLHLARHVKLKHVSKFGILKRHFDRHKMDSIDKGEFKNLAHCSICWKTFS